MFNTKDIENYLKSVSNKEYGEKQHKITEEMVKVFESSDPMAELVVDLILCVAKQNGLTRIEMLRYHEFCSDLVTRAFAGGALLGYTLGIKEGFKEDRIPHDIQNNTSSQGSTCK